MAKTIAGLYDDRTTAQTVVRDLESIGFGNDHLRFASSANGPDTGYDVDVKKDFSTDMLKSYGISDEETQFYAEGVRRGGSLVVARVHDADVNKAVDIMARHNPVRYEDRGKDYVAAHGTETEMYDADRARQERDRYADQTQERLREIEEHLKIGKREVVRGGVRVHQVVDTDVQEETLRLREEHVNVERTDVNRTLTPDEADAAFEEKTIEMVERSEEAVVEKETVVTGEVSVGKDVSMREETVGGEVRSTRVEVEQIADGGDMDADFKSHYDKTYRSSGRDYDSIKPAYQYGYNARQTHGDRDFADVENDLRSDFSRQHNGDDSLWDDTKDAVRHGWNKAKNAVS